MFNQRHECPTQMPSRYYDSEDLFLQVRDNTLYIASLYANGMLDDECAARYGLPGLDAKPCDRSRALHDFVEKSYPGRAIAHQLCRGHPTCRSNLGEIRLWRELDCVTEECERARFGCGTYPLRSPRHRRRWFRRRPRFW